MELKTEKMVAELDASMRRCKAFAALYIAIAIGSVSAIVQTIIQYKLTVGITLILAAFVFFIFFSLVEARGHIRDYYRYKDLRKLFSEGGGRYFERGAD